MRRKAVTCLTKRSTRRFCSSPAHFRSLSQVETIPGPIDTIDINEFRKKAFTPETPLLIKRESSGGFPAALSPSSSIPAAVKWFTFEDFDNANESSNPQQTLVPSQYLHTFQDTILPYELTYDLAEDPTKPHGQAGGSKDLKGMLSQLLQNPSAGSFHRFNAPLSLFLQACRTNAGASPLLRLYIAQAQITDLPKQLQEDLPTPRLVREAGKGDIYDANIWIGIPPTYTPLHRDPNPNLFVQLASSKQVRLYRPSVGAGIFRHVQRSIGQSGQTNLRGEEMMEGPERDALDEAVWGDSAIQDGFEAIVNPDEALFIPKGWWHSIKSIGTDVTASVNWWFR
ncbi:hypothetical protein M430DRAFT_23296 [Amorphotheca resinae ATCC 22711]|jgi:hypothetical protein|uniref:JmjC domain-containing protein n=1 Tax=Amorphotheca resinae ATCC 22711 TaxID=857342 RepID=A0A2T3AQ62_AMORE|nr:hypothetical protein M430DRAFT_23296 [Amorphotheca resinae ATCC 22711]PSS07146.1 hypothetical protein M430DRAFT_23296 [Amorphotheca resinae ATCC 22711]